EDESEIRKLLVRIIEKQEDFQVVMESGDFASAVTDFTKYRPDVVFVDIDLQGESGLECAKVLTELSPKLKVIFATAHSEYMANAFEIYAFDYLVKPFNVERVVRTLDRVKGLMEPGESTAVGTETETIHSEVHKDKLLIKGKEQIILVDKKDILLVERCDSATNIVTTEGIFKTSVGLSGIEEKLSTTEFMRCHKSYIINISKITRIEPYGRWTYVVKLKGTETTALMTAQNYEMIKAMFG
ncbi:MAG: response regulator transcription factor, partial [Lachnospiraceae bacterium]|nr:response regulator transcription factor [Lachnospiraceae bacterium]